MAILVKQKVTPVFILMIRKLYLTADSGEYYFNEDRAFFESKVKLL